jgi:hypothetical protein
MVCPSCKHVGPPEVSGPYALTEIVKSLWAVMVCQNCGVILGGGPIPEDQIVTSKVEPATGSGGLPLAA